MSTDKEKADLDQQIEIFKVKKLMKNLEAARGNGTSMISLIIPPGDQISRVNRCCRNTEQHRISVASELIVGARRLPVQTASQIYNKCPPTIAAFADRYGR
jgi:peptide chain release factor subunit 1